MMYLLTDKYIGASLDLYGEYCESEAEVFAQLLSPGETVVEVGANIGAHTVHLSQLVGSAGRVYALEPQRVIFQLLCTNVAINEAFNVHTFHAGAGAAAGSMKLPEINYHYPDSNFGGVSLLEQTQGDEVRIISLDSLTLPSLRLIKIDVEGMEDVVLEGAREQILHHRPVLYVENDRRDHSAELISMIEHFGYDLWWHFAPLFNPDNFAGVAENIFNNVVSVNLLCVPKEHHSTITGFRKVSGPDEWWEDFCA
ncbi:MAG: FkbM family methyltransferase [Acidocella sp.]|nr:FkbM family methyltransferase [Acidocella sp.]